eukprot:GHVN01047332.1.p1 GENE.GHVN01047332.1~~GHVN01047332.1.p1  ORF type:complete len:167 (+),score=6.72 GHVN01047332.1:88-588(+)
MCSILHSRWTDFEANEKIRQRFGMDLHMETLILKQRLRWLGHVLRSSDNEKCKQILCGALEGRRPPCGPRQRWRDVTLRYLKSVGLGYETIYEAAQGGKMLRDACEVGERQQSERDKRKRLARRQYRLRKGEVEMRNGRIVYRCLHCPRTCATKRGQAVHLSSKHP